MLGFALRAHAARSLAQHAVLATSGDRVWGVFMGGEGARDAGFVTATNIEG